MLDILEVPYTAEPADQDLLAALQKDTSRGDGVRALGGAKHFVDPYSVGTKPLRIEKHLILLDRPADGNDLRDSRNGEKPFSHHPVCDGTNLHRRVTVTRHTDEQDLSHDRCDGSENGRAHPGGKLRHHELKLFAYDLAGPVDVLTPVELDPHDADSLSRGGANPSHPRRAVDGRLYRKSDEDLDFLRRHAVCLGEHGDGRRGQIGKNVDGYRDPGVGARREKGRGTEDRHQPIAQ
jgi:hypothetical protein